MSGWGCEFWCAGVSEVVLAWVVFVEVILAEVMQTVYLSDSSRNVPVNCPWDL